MSNLLIGALSALIATNQAEALSNLVTQTTGIAVTAVSTNSPLEAELQKIEDDDDEAAAEVDGWIRQNDEFAQKGAAIPAKELNQRIRRRFDSIRTAYEDFIKAHPDYAPARVAYGSFLHDIGDEEGQYDQLLKARDLDPKMPSIWNNLGNYYGEHGPMTNAFICYEKAIELDPTEPVYYHNFGTTVYLYRKDVREYYHINEQQVFDKALGLYSNSMRLDPTNFPLASDVAMSYYGIKPLRTNDALMSWSNALHLAHDEVERQGVYIHLARIQISAGNFAVAREHLDAVTNPMYNDLKTRVLRSLNQHEHPELETNSPPETPAIPVESKTTNAPAKVP